MRVLLSGISSFTGMHIAEQLALSDHAVVGTITQPLSHYTGHKKIRIQRLSAIQIAENTPFGSDSFIRLIQQFRPEVYIHHGFNTTGYQDTDFPIEERVALAVNNLKSCTQMLIENGCKGVIYSDSIFAGTGAVDCNGSVPFSSYGIAKKKVGDLVSQRCSEAGLLFWRQVIPNPIGPFDNFKLLQYVFERWSNGQTPVITTPDLVRDNIPVVLLAKDYLRLIEEIRLGQGGISNPSGWACTVKDLVNRAAAEWRLQTAQVTPIRLEPQCTQQPQTLVNTDPIWDRNPNWSERPFWSSVMAEHLPNSHLVIQRKSGPYLK